MSRRKPIPRCCRCRSTRRSSRRRRGFRWGAMFWSALGGLVLLGLGLGVANLIEDLFARSESLGFLGLAFACARGAGACRRHRRARRSGWRGLRQSRNCICAPPKCLLSDDRAASRAIVRDLLETRAPEPATGARPRRAAGPCRRHHRRRRHDPARRARIDDAARSGGAPAGLVGGAARFDRHRRQPARADRRAVRVRGVAAA